MQIAFFPSACAVIVAVPCLIPVTNPSCVTVATEVSLLVQLIFEPVEEAIEFGKEIFNEEYAQLMEKQNLHWSDKGVRVLPQLHISVSGFLEKEQKFDYELIVFFEDRENTDLSMSVDIDVDLSSYREVLIDMVTEAFKQEILRMI